MKQERVKILKKGNVGTGPIVYWMSRDQRINDNWALVFALNLANEYGKPLVIVFNLVKKFLDATYRHFHFMIGGLKEVHQQAKQNGIGFRLLIGDPIENIPKFIQQTKAFALVTDFDPLKIKRYWKNSINNKIEIPFFEVDAHNIVPVFFASDRMEFAAYTYRPKVTKLLPYFLDEFPQIDASKKTDEVDDVEWGALLESLEIDKNVREVTDIKAGEKEAFRTLEVFIDQKLNKYAEFRNNPNYDYQSGLSPYLHFGQISAQRVVLEVKKLGIDDQNTQSFLEELIIRRELSDNYCYYNENYDNNNGFPEWAINSLQEHSNDEREYVYTLEQFEKAQTHEDLWNAAQMELVNKGKMHGYMRMYWAKKILEWTPNTEIAQKIAIYLNDKYSLDGRDPNGYTGIAWSIGGVHDRPWTERPVFGKIRYMNLNGAMRKFDVKQYIQNNLKTGLF